MTNSPTKKEFVIKIANALTEVVLDTTINTDGSIDDIIKNIEHFKTEEEEIVVTDKKLFMSKKLVPEYNAEIWEIVSCEEGIDNLTESIYATINKLGLKSDKPKAANMSDKPKRSRNIRVGAEKKTKVVKPKKEEPSVEDLEAVEVEETEDVANIDEDSFFNVDDADSIVDDVIQEDPIQEDPVDGADTQEQEESINGVDDTYVYDPAYDIDSAIQELQKNQDILVAELNRIKSLLTNMASILLLVDEDPITAITKSETIKRIQQNKNAPKKPKVRATAPERKERFQFMLDLLGEGAYTQKEIIQKTHKKYPEFKEATIRVYLFQGRNKETTPFKNLTDKLICVNADSTFGLV